MYAAFVFVSARRMCRHSYQRLRDRVMVQAQSETIGFLLKDFAEGTSDWLWETDTVGRLRQARAAVAALLGVEAAALRHRTLSELLRAFADPDGDGADAEAVAAAIAARAPSATEPSGSVPRKARAGSRSTASPSSTRKGRSRAIAAWGRTPPRAERRRPASRSWRVTTA
ncbi:hypothetical protein ACU4GA_30470 [Methylobacterium oryzae CBMB20]